MPLQAVNSGEDCQRQANGRLTSLLFGGLRVRCEQRWETCGIAARHAAFGGHAVDADIALSSGEASGVAGHVVAVNEAKIELGFRAQLQPGERCKIGVVCARFRHRQVEELNQPADRPALIPVLTAHMLGEVAAIARTLPNERIAVQWDVCQEVIAWEGYYEPGPVDFRKETIAELIAIGDGVPAAIELGYHLCYGSPADEHVIQPKDAGIMVEIVNAVSAGVRRSIQFFHLPVPKPRTDNAYFAPLAALKLRPETELYLGLVHRDDMAGNAARLASARRHVRVDGLATECGMARGDPERFPALLAAHAQTAELVAVGTTQKEN